MNRRDENKPRERSTLAKVMSVLAPVAVVAGAAAKWHYGRPKGPIPAKNPADLQKPLIGGTGPLIRHEDVAGDIKSTRWLTHDQYEGKVPHASAPKSVFHEAPSLKAPVGTAADALHADKLAAAMSRLNHEDAKKAAAKTLRAEARSALNAAKNANAPAVVLPPPPVVTAMPGAAKTPVTQPSAPEAPKAPKAPPAPPAPPVPPVPDVKEITPNPFNKDAGAAAQNATAPGKGALPAGGRRILTEGPKAQVTKGSKGRTRRDPKPSVGKVSKKSQKAAAASEVSTARLSYSDYAAQVAADNERHRAAGRPTRTKLPSEEEYNAPGWKAEHYEEAPEAPKKGGSTLPTSKKKSLAEALLRAKKKNGTALSSRLLVTYFNSRDESSGVFGAADTFSSQYRRARRLMPWVNRGQGAAEDAGDIASGRKVADPFYKKTWFKTAAAGAAVAAPFAAVRKWNALASQHYHYPNSIAAMHPITGRAQERFLKVGQSIDDWLVRKGVFKQRRLTNPELGPLFSSKLHTKYLQARMRRIFFDLQSEERGWDLRDARGRSARVYAPGSRRRERREKTWDEKTDNIRAMRNAAVGTAVAGGLGAAYLGHRLHVANRVVNSAAASEKAAVADAIARTAAAEKANYARAEEVWRQKAAGELNGTRFKLHRAKAALAKANAKLAQANLEQIEIEAAQAEMRKRHNQLTHQAYDQALSAPLRLTQFNSLHRLVKAGEDNIELPKGETEQIVRATLEDESRRRLAGRLLTGTAVIGGGTLGGYLIGRHAGGGITRAGDKVVSVTSRARDAVAGGVNNVGNRLISGTRRLTKSAAATAPRWGAIGGAALGGLGAGLLLP